MIRVVTSSESAARDASAIASGVPSRALMQRAGAGAAAEIALRYRDRLGEGVVVYAGPGNNGGDGWVVARALAAAGARVNVVEPVDARTSDAQAERSLARASMRSDSSGDERLVVDALLGTGASGAPRGEIADAVHQIRGRRERGAIVVALDVPSGVDATTGDVADPSVVADLTLTFGTMKRGHLVARDACGTIAVLDIGLGVHADRDDGAPLLVDERWAAERLPRWTAGAHKGDRKKLAIVGGSRGMAGAAMLAARGAARSGIGMVKLVVAGESVPIVQESEPYALSAAWPRTAGEVDSAIGEWADAIVIGPGLGLGDASRALLELVLTTWRGPTIIDADALTLFEGKAAQLAELLEGRPALITPHVVEFMRISGVARDEVMAHRFDAAVQLAGALRSAIVLKGVPTVITSPSGERLVSATGTPALGTGGSGDVLSGIAGTLLAQINDPFVAGALGAFVHGRAAERVPTMSGVRGIVLDDVVSELRNAWDFDATPARYPVLAELPAIVA
jgi:NAD(P)H-hydrate epimerase